MSYAASCTIALRQANYLTCWGGHVTSTCGRGWVDGRYFRDYQMTFPAGLVINLKKGGTGVKGIKVSWIHSPPSIDLHGVSVLSFSCR